MNNSSVVIDASLLAKIRFPEDFSEATNLLYDTWAVGSKQVVAPLLIFYEIVSTANKKLLRGLATPDEAESALEFMLTEPIEVVISDDMHRSALRIAQRLGLRSTYDAHYLAVAEELDCEFWTADERLYNSVRDRFPLIRWVGAA